MFHQNILDISTWTVGTGSVTGFTRNGSTDENYRFYDVDPWGNSIVIWEARPLGDDGADGGWNTTSFAIDITKMYRFSVWVNRTVQSTSGGFYFGCNALNGSDSIISIQNRYDDTTYTNPYFYIAGGGTSVPGSALPTGVWVLVVGHIWPYGTGTGNMYSDSGRYTLSSGRIGSISRDFRWMADNIRVRHRSYLYYADQTEARQRWCYPRVDLCDGTEPSIQSLLRNQSFYTNLTFGSHVINFKCKDVLRN